MISVLVLALNTGISLARLPSGLYSSDDIFFSYTWIWGRGVLTKVRRLSVQLVPGDRPIGIHRGRGLIESASGFFFLECLNFPYVPRTSQFEVLQAIVRLT